jgi:hypothetical protein
MNYNQRICCLAVVISCCLLSTQTSRAQRAKPTDRQAAIKSITDNLNTPLDATLKWLKAELSKYGTTNGGGYFYQLKPTRVAGCEFAFRYGPTVLPERSGSTVSVPPSEHEYSFNFADLDPGSITVSTSGDTTRIGIGTWDLEPKVKVVTKDPITGKSIEYSNRTVEGVRLNLAKTKSAEQIRDAFVHAILLCQKQP